MNRRRILIVLLVLAALPLVGAGWQRLATHRDQRLQHPPPGDLVAIDYGPVLHLHTQGDHHRKDNPENPMVLLDAGTPGFSAQWSFVQQAIAEFATVVSCDRVAEATHLSLLTDSEHSGATVDAVQATLTAAETAAKKQR